MCVVHTLTALFSSFSLCKSVPLSLQLSARLESFNCCHSGCSVPCFPSHPTALQTLMGCQKPIPSSGLMQKLSSPGSHPTELQHRFCIPPTRCAQKQGVAKLPGSARPAWLPRLLGWAASSGHTRETRGIRTVKHQHRSCRSSQRVRLAVEVGANGQRASGLPSLNRESPIY